METHRGRVVGVFSGKGVVFKGRVGNWGTVRICREGEHERHPPPVRAGIEGGSWSINCEDVHSLMVPLMGNH